MYDANLSYEENYRKGPFSHLTEEKKFPKIKYTGQPQFEFLGIPLHIPFGVPAGPLLNSQFVKVALDAGFCLPTYKTVRSSFWKCHDWPNVLSIQARQQSLFASHENKVEASSFTDEDYLKKDLSISNSFGVPSQSPEIWSADFQALKTYSQDEGSHVVLSFQGSTWDATSATEAQRLLFEDAQKTCELAMKAASKTGFCLLEINLSCPNEKHLPIYKDIPSAVKLLSFVHKALQASKQVKLIAKIGALTKDETKIFLAEAGIYLNAVSAINTVSADILTADGKIALGSQSISGGVCGRLIFEQGIQMASRLVEARAQLGIKKQDLGLIGVGGVTTVDDFKAYRNVGVDVVQAATGMMWNLSLALEIASSLGVSYNYLKD